jgi:hypothetical protein
MNEEPVFTETRHMCMSIEGALKRKNLSGIATEGGLPATDRQFREYLKYKQAMGWRVVPMDGCDNFDPIHGCKGHPAKQP